MSILDPVVLESASAEQKKVLDPIKAKFGKVPNIYAAMSHSATTLDAMLVYGQALRKGTLNAKEIEAIALVIGQKNDCEYCVAAHTAIAKSQGVTEEETVEFRKGKSRDLKLQALVRFAAEIEATKGFVSDEALKAFLAAGYSAASVVEVTAWVAYNTFTNYFNHVARTPIDFPAAPEASCGGSCGCSCS